MWFIYDWIKGITFLEDHPVNIPTKFGSIDPVVPKKKIKM
jgi:hypothetical protein